MSTRPSAVMLCVWGVKARWLIPRTWINVWVAGDPVNTCRTECFSVESDSVLSAVQMSSLLWSALA